MRLGKCPDCADLRSRLALMSEQASAFMDTLDAERQRYERLVETMSTMVRDGYRPSQPPPTGPEPPRIDPAVQDAINRVTGGARSDLHRQLMQFALQETAAHTPADQIAAQIEAGGG